MLKNKMRGRTRAKRSYGKSICALLMALSMLMGSSISTLAAGGPQGSGLGAGQDGTAYAPDSVSGNDTDGTGQEESKEETGQGGIVTQPDTVSGSDDKSLKNVNFTTGQEGVTYYLDSVDGDDANDGLSPQNAWKSLAMVDQKVFQPGDRILFRAGSQFYGRFHPLGSGTEQDPVTVDVYDGDKVGSEAGARAAIHGEGKYTHVIFLENMEYWNISNLEISNKGSDNNSLRVGINVEITQPGIYNGIHLNNLYVHDVTGTLTGKDKRNGGIFFTVNADKAAIKGNTAHFNDILIENCYVADVSRTGISMGYTTMGPDMNGLGGIMPQDMLDNYFHTNVVVRNNYVQRAGGDGIVTMFCISPLIEYNVADSCSQNTAGNPGAMYNAGIWPWRCEDALFQFNEVFGTKLNGDGQAFDCDFSRGTIYQYNYSHDNEGGFMLVCQGESLESVIRYNVSQNDGRSLFMLSNTNEAVFYNNTFFVKDADIDSGHGGIATMYNNIFYLAGEAKNKNWGSNTHYNNNLYFGFANLPTDTAKIIGDPDFADPGKGGTGSLGAPAINTLEGYRLKAGSPAVNAGRVISENGGKDYEGNVLDALADLGAFEFVPTTKAELEVYYAQYSQMDLKGYSQASAASLKQVLSDADGVLKQDNPGAQAVSSVYGRLTAAVAGLEKEQTGEPLLRVGIVSDAQAMPDNSLGIRNFRKALSILKEKDIDLLLDAGDVSETGSDVTWKEYMQVFRDAYPETQARPEYLVTMGNHDYYGSGSDEEHRRLFNEIFEKPETNEHRVVGGYHFLNITSYDSTSRYTTEDLKWLDSEIQKAIEDKPDQPVFVVGHPHATDTVYGSSTGWGNNQLSSVFNKYEQVVYFSGHSHYPLDDERSIYQNLYTAIGTSSMNYLEMEQGKDQGIHPDGVWDNAQIQYMEIYSDRIEIERIDLVNERQIKDKWVLQLPLQRDTFTYTPDRADSRKAPVFGPDAKITADEVGGSYCKLTFTQAQHEDFTHSYRIKAVDKKTGKTTKNITIFSDFYNGIQDMKPELTYTLSGLKSNTEYVIEISGIESFGKEGSPIKTEVKTIDALLADIAFDDGALKDSSKYGTQFTVTGNPVVALDETLGRNVMKFDGSSYVSLKLSEEQLNATKGNYTFETVFKLDKLGSTQDVFGNGEQAGVCLEVTPGGNAQFWTWSVDKGGYVKTDTQVEAGRYYHYLVTYDGKEISVYLDGQKVDTQDMTGSLKHPSGVDFSFGVDPAPNGANQGCFLNGSIASFRMDGAGVDGLEAYERYMEYKNEGTEKDLNVVADIDFSGEAMADSSAFETELTAGGAPEILYDQEIKQNVVSLDGSSYAFLKVNDYQLGQITNQFTLETVFKLDKLGGTQDIVANSESAGFCLEVTPGGNAQMWVWSAQLNDYVCTDTQIEAGKYYHYMAVYDGENIIVYLNGQEADRKAMSGSIKHPDPLKIPICIGGDPQPNANARYFMSGRIGRLVLEGTPVDAEKASARYLEWKSGFEEEPQPPKVDRTKLEELIASCEGTNEKLYTKESWENFARELENARTVYGREDVSQTQIDDAFMALFLAKDALVYNVDKKLLLDTIKTAEAADISNCTEESVKFFNQALEKARRIAKDETADQDAVNDMVTELLRAIVQLTDGEDLARLRELVESAKEVLAQKEKFTAQSFEAFEKALKKAEDVLKNSSASTEEIKEAHSDLAGKMTGLVVRANKTSLKTVLDLAEFILSDQDLYMPATLKDLDKVTARARAVWEKDDASQQEVDMSAQLLKDAVAGVRVKADKRDLFLLKEKVDKLDMTLYTEASAAALTGLLPRVALVLEDENATQEEVDRMTNELLSSVNNLEEKKSDSGSEQNPDDNNGQDSGKEENPDDSNGGASNEQTGTMDQTVISPKTGDPAPLLEVTLLLMVSACVCAAVAVRSKKKHK